jgi:hypothetical protein
MSRCTAQIREEAFISIDKPISLPVLCGGNGIRRDGSLVFQRRCLMMFRLSAGMTALALGLFLSVSAWGQEKTATHEGTVVSVSGNKLTMKGEGAQAKEHTHTLAADAKVICDGKECKLSDLKPGMHVRVTTPTDNQAQATRIEAQSSRGEQRTGAESPRGEQRTSQAFLGIRGEPVADRPTGVLIRALDPNGPASQAGLRNGDIITAVGDKKVREFETLVNALAQHKPGDKVTLYFRRDGKDQNLEVTLGQRPAQPQNEAAVPQATRPTAFLGVAAMPLTTEEKNRLGVTADNGAVIMEVAPNTPAAKAGLARDDVITAVNDQPITNPMQLRQAVQKAGPGKDVTIKALRGTETKEFKARLEEAPADIFTPPAER